MKTGAEAIRALATQLPAFRQKLSDGWYQVRIAGRDVSTSGLTAQLHETLPDGAVIHIVPRVAGAKSGGVFQIVLGAAAIAGSFFTAGATLAAWGAAIGAGGMTGILFSLGASICATPPSTILAPRENRMPVIPPAPMAAPHAARVAPAVKNDPAMAAAPRTIWNTPPDLAPATLGRLCLMAL